MMKCEFEEMVGKEVTVEVFEMYNSMYLALPESVNKQAFVAMLNIEAIPESPEAIERKESHKKFVDGVKAEIQERRQALKEYKRFKENAVFGLSVWKGDEEMTAHYEIELTYWRKQIRYEKNKIRDLKFLIAEQKYNRPPSVKTAERR